jgi:hypothetical protein
MVEENEDIRNRQIFGKLERILLSGDGEIYIVLTKDKIGEAMIGFLKNLERNYKGKDVIVTFHSLERGRKRKEDD